MTGLQYDWIMTGFGKISGSEFPVLETSHGNHAYKPFLMGIREGYDWI